MQGEQTRAKSQNIPQSPLDKTSDSSMAYSGSTQ